MDKTVPAPAAKLLDFIGDTEVGRKPPEAYNVVYGHNKTLRPIVEMTVDEVIAAQSGFTRDFGSSATGRYQFMKATLEGLKKELGLRAVQLMSGNLQDRLAYHLLKRRGYERWIAGKLSDEAFALHLAMEWASFPVLFSTRGAHREVKRGQSYYAGDGVNKALVSPEKIEDLLVLAKATPLGETQSTKEPAMSFPNTAVVDIKSASSSKINWTQMVAVLASLLIVFGIDLNTETQLMIVAGIQGAQSVITWVLRTWFTKTVTAASLP